MEIKKLFTAIEIFHIVQNDRFACHSEHSEESRLRYIRFFTTFRMTDSFRMENKQKCRYRFKAISALYNNRTRKLTFSYFS